MKNRNHNEAKVSQNICNKNALFGPPDKCQHYDGNSTPTSKRKKTDKSGCDRREVEALYADGVWYRGWLSYNFEKGK